MILVTGITRSGTSMVAQMLHAAGLKCIGEPPAFEVYKPQEINWHDFIDRDVVVKMPDVHYVPPPPGDYRVIVMHRNVVEQAKSMAKFLAWVGVEFDFSQPEIIEESIRRDYVHLDFLFSSYQVLNLGFEYIIEQPWHAAMAIARCLEMDLDQVAMRQCVVSRSARCLPDMLEIELVKKYRTPKSAIWMPGD